MITEIDPQKIADNLQKILFDDALPNFQDAFKKVRNKYSWKSYGQSLMTFMAQL